MSALHVDEISLAIRRLIKKPRASLASVLTLACGLAAAATTWTLLAAVLVSPLPVRSPESLQVVGIQYLTRDGTPGRASYAHVYPQFPAIRDSGAFASVAAIGRYPLMVDEGGQPQSRAAYFASGNFFETIGVRLAMGPGFGPDNDQRGAAPVAVLSDRYWRLHFDADPHVVGKTIIVGGAATTIVGIAPPKFRGLSLAEAPDFYMPLHALVALIDPDRNFFMDGSSRSSPTMWLTVIGRLDAGSTVERARQTLSASREGTPRGAEGAPVFTDINTAALPEASRDGMRQFTRLLAITVGLLLFIGSLTVGMLLLIRTEARRDEFAMCLALGATRTRLAVGVVFEGLLLSFSAVLVSLPFTFLLLGGVSAFQLPGGVDLARLEMSVGLSTLAAAAGAAIIASTLIGLVAGLFGVSANIADVLRARAGATPRLTRRRWRMALVGTQVAVTVVLLGGAGLFARSLVAALNLNPGFDPGRVITGSIELRPYGYSPARASEFFESLHARLRRHPSIRSASMTMSLGGMTPSGEIIIDGDRRKFPSTVAYTAVDKHFFSTMGMQIQKGRDFSDEDSPGSPPVIVVSESFGRMLANGGDPIGHTITESSGRPGQAPSVERIIGVAPDVVNNVAVLEPLVIYYPLAQRDTYTARRVVLRAANDPGVVIQEATAAIRAIDPLLPAPFDTMQNRIQLQMGPQRFGVTVLGALSAIALLLTVLGTYVLAETMTAVRQREMGIRAALGATRRQLGHLVLKETATLVAAGLSAGLGLAWLGAGTIRAFLFQVEPLDVTTLSGVSMVILVLALGVSLRPALRAGRVELARLLRED